MPTTDFWSALPIASAQPFSLRFRQELSGQASGTPRVADLGPEVWTTSIRTSGRIRRQRLMQILAQLEALGGGRDTFYAWEPLAEYPQSDPDGSVLGASAVVIDTLDDDARFLKLGGLPSGYVLTAGDFLAFDWGTPAHRALHRIVAGGTADGSGVTPLLRVVPEIRAGAEEETSVSLIRAAAEMMILPGSARPDMAGPMRGSLSFDVAQVP
jgi:hypothetical protein